MREYGGPRPADAAMRRILEAEPASPEGVVLRLAWQQGLSRDEISDLTWEQVSFLDDRLELPDRMIPLEAEVRSCLWRLFQAHSEVSPYVVLSSRDRTPLRPESISRLARQALDREGQTSVRLMDRRPRPGLRRRGREPRPLRDPRRDASREDEDARLLARTAERGMLTRGEVMELLGLSKTAAYGRLHRLTEQGRLVRIGGKYYLPSDVVPPEQHLETIRAYLSRAGFAYRQDIADLLHIQRKQCALILRHMVEQGELVQSGQKYYLPQSGDRKAE